MHTTLHTVKATQHPYPHITVYLSSSQCTLHGPSLCIQLSFIFTKKVAPPPLIFSWWLLLAASLTALRLQRQRCRSCGDNSGQSPLYSPGRINSSSSEEGSLEVKQEPSEVQGGLNYDPNDEFDLRNTSLFYQQGDISFSSSASD